MSYFDRPEHLKKLLGIYQLDLAAVLDGHRPFSFAISVWTGDMSQAETQEFLERRIAFIIARLMLVEDR